MADEPVYSSWLTTNYAKTKAAENNQGGFHHD